MRARFRTRVPTAAWRGLPDFLIIGAQRCGTSSLYKYLGQHPGVSPSLRKEVGWFSRSFAHDLTWYRSHFSLVAPPARQRFEATPDYLLHPLAAERSAAALPGAKLIVLLRDPVARALSHHQHMVRLGFEDLPVMEALTREPERTAADRARIFDDPAHDPRYFLRFSYFERGLYAEQLIRWFDAYDRDRFLLLESADLYADPGATLVAVETFLGLKEWLPRDFRNYSYVGKPPGDREEARRDGAAAYLRSRYADADAALADLVGRRLSWMD